MPPLCQGDLEEIREREPQRRRHPRPAAEARRRPAQLREADRRGARGVRRGGHRRHPRGRRRAAPGSGSGLSTATSRPARTCSKPSTSTKSQAICDSAEKYVDQPPLEALTGWLHEFVGFAATKRALAEELFAYVDRDSPVFSSCANAIYGAGEDLLKRAQEAGAVRADVDISDVTKMVGGIAAIRTADAEQIDRILGLALDGLRVASEG